jgi:hypothetical protein
MISTMKATMHKMVGALADDLLPPRDLAKAAFAVMVWASSKMSAEQRDKLLTGFGIAIRDRVSARCRTPPYRGKVRALAVPRASNPRSGQKEAQPRHQGLADNRGRNAVSHCSERVRLHFENSVKIALSPLTSAAWWHQRDNRSCRAACKENLAPHPTVSARCVSLR